MNHTLRQPNLFPEGTEVGAYVSAAFPAYFTGGPPMDPVDTQIVADGEVTFEGLTKGREYRAMALVDGGWRWVQFTVGADYDPLTPAFEEALATKADQSDLDAHTASTLVHGVDTTELATQAMVTAATAAATAALASHDSDDDAHPQFDLGVMHSNVFNVAYAEYGADPDAADNRAAIQQALDAAHAAGGGVVLVPDFYEVEGVVNVGDNTRFRGTGRDCSGIRSAADSAAGALVRIRGDQRSCVEHMTVDCNGRDGSGSHNILVEPANVATVASDHAVRWCRLIDGTSSACRVPYPVADFTFEHNVVEGVTGQYGGSGGLTMYADDAADTTGTVVLRNRFRDVGGVNIQLRSDPALGYTIRPFAGGQIAHNDLRDFPTPASDIPVEITGCKDFAVVANVIPTACTRGISTGWCTDLALHANVIKHQSIYAFELNQGNGISIVGNVVEDCASFAQQSSTTNPLEDVLIEANIYRGSGLSSAPANQNAIYLQNCKGIKVKGNLFDDGEYLTRFIRVGSGSLAEDVSVEDNTFIIRDTNTPLICVLLSLAKRSQVENNKVYVERALAAADDYLAPIMLTNNATSEKLDVEDNKIHFGGSVAAAPNSAGISSGNVGFGALAGVNVLDNRITGAAIGHRLMINSADLNVARNDIRGAAAASTPDPVPTVASAATVTLPIGADVVKISGSTAITSITAQAGKRVTLVFTATATLTDGGNLKIAGDLVATADDAISLVCDGTNWFETGRAVN